MLRYLVGCDGTSSQVCEAIGGTLSDFVFDEPWLVLDVVVDPDNDPLPDNVQHCDPERPSTFIVMGANRRRFEFMLKPGETAEVMLTDAAIQSLIAPWQARGIREIERRAVYRFHALIADRWRSERVFLAGDAAHQMPPFAGQGMCSGMRDAAALAWRIALATGGKCGEWIFSTYQREREPHVRALTEAAARDAQMLAARAAGEPLPDISSPPLNIVFGLPSTPRAGERFFQPTVGKGADITRLDDVLGVGSWLISRIPPADLAAPGLRVIGLDDPALHPFRRSLADWLTTTGEEGVLVRADRYVFGTGDTAELMRSYAEQVAKAAIAPMTDGRGDYGPDPQAALLSNLESN